MLSQFKNELSLRMIRFEGITVRSDALPTIALLRDEALTVNAAARARGASCGSTSNTLRRLHAVGVLETVPLPPCTSKHASSREPLRGYRCTDMGKRLISSALQMLESMEPEDPEARWPSRNPDRIVSRAMRTQPNSVFVLAASHV
jgi:hypothetical protein